MATRRPPGCRATEVAVSGAWSTVEPMAGASRSFACSAAWSRRAEAFDVAWATYSDS